MISWPLSAGVQARGFLYWPVALSLNESANHTLLLEGVSMGTIDRIIDYLDPLPQRPQSPKSLSQVVFVVPVLVIKPRSPNPVAPNRFRKPK